MIILKTFIVFTKYNSTKTFLDDMISFFFGELCCAGEKWPIVFVIS